MMDWKPATKQEVLDALARDLASVDNETTARLGDALVEPEVGQVERCGHPEPVFVVARIGMMVVFFDDVEDNFVLGRENAGPITDTVDCVHLAVALHELKREAARLSDEQKTTHARQS